MKKLIFLAAIVVFEFSLLGQVFAGAVLYDKVPAKDRLSELSESEKKLLPNFCQFQDSTILKSVKIKASAEFFFRPFPLSDRLTYSANTQNFILDLKTGKSTPVAGKYDGFPTPDEKLFVVAHGVDGIKIYDNQNFKVPIFEDKSQTGFYQSCGVLEKSGGQTVYRIMLNNTSGGYSFKDYSSQNGKIQAVQKTATPLCPNYSNLSLPMLSKDGHSLAAYDAASQTTEIFSIDSKSGACKIIHSLGVNAGKVDFSFDGETVTYAQIAVSSFNSQSLDTPGWMRSPRSDMVSNIYTQNLKTGETRALTHFTNSNVLYPSFNSKGEIIARKFDKDGTEFLKLNPNIVSSHKKKIDVSRIACENMDKNTKVALGLGAIFLNYCDQNRQNWEPEGIILLGKELSPKQCHELLNKWSKEESLEDLSFLKVSLVRKNLDSRVLKDISRKDLAAACGK